MTATTGSIEVDIEDVCSTMTLVLRVHGLNCLGVRLRLTGWLLKLASIVSPVNIELEVI